jgi:integrase
VSLPRQERKEAATLSGSECRRLLKEAKGRDIYVPVLLALTTGMRRGEICALRWTDVDLAQGIMQVSRNAVDTPDGITYKGTKTGKCRAIMLPGFVTRELLEYRQSERVRHISGGLLYYGSPGYLSTRFARFANEHGFKVTFHGLRHTHATLLLAGGVDMKVTQVRLGHSTMAMTADRYSHLSAGMQETASAAIEEVLG